MKTVCTDKRRYLPTPYPQKEKKKRERAAVRCTCDTEQAKMTELQVAIEGSVLCLCTPSSALRSINPFILPSLFSVYIERLKFIYICVCVCVYIYIYT